jgi:hypothetical protein
MKHPENPSGPGAGNPTERDVPADPTSGTEDRVVQEREGEIPVQGSGQTAEDLARRAFGDKDRDGDADVPNAPFPG